MSSVEGIRFAPRNACLPVCKVLYTELPYLPDINKDKILYAVRAKNCKQLIVLPADKTIVQVWTECLFSHVNAMGTLKQVQREILKTHYIHNLKQVH